MPSSDEDNDAVQDALDEFSDSHFDEPEDSDVDLKLLHEAKMLLPSCPTPTHTTWLLKGNAQKVRDLGQISSLAGFGTVLNQALGLPSSLAPSSSFCNEDYIEAVMDVIFMAADDNEQAALLTRELELIEQIIKEPMESHNVEWTEMANKLRIELEDILQYVYQAQVAKKGKECLEEWFHQNLGKLEEIEGAVMWNSMSALSCSKMMAKTVTDMSKKNFQYELFRFVMNREVLDGQVMANAYIFLSSKATARILDKHIWSNMEPCKKFQLDLINIKETPGDDNKPPTLEMWEEYSKRLAATSKTQQVGLNEVRAAISAKMMHHLRSIFEQQGAEVQLSQGFPWNNLANFIYTNHPSFTIHNWPSTVPYSWVGEMNSRQVQLLLQSLIIGFIYEEKNSDERILKPNSHIVFEPFNPSKIIIPQESNPTCILILPSKPSVMRKGALDLVGAGVPIEDNDCPQKVHAAKAHSATKVRTSMKVHVATKVPLNKMKDARSTKSRYHSASEDRANDSSDDDEYDNGNDSEAQPIHSKHGSIKEHVSRRDLDRRASKIKGKELEACSQKGCYNLRTDDSGEEEEGDKDEDNEDEEVKAVVGIRKPSPKKVMKSSKGASRKSYDVLPWAIQPAKDHREKLMVISHKCPTDKSTTHHEMECKQVCNEWKKVGSSHELPQASPSPKVNSQARKVEKVGPLQGFKKSAQVPTKEKSAITGKDVKKCHIYNCVPSPTTEKSPVTRKDTKKQPVEGTPLSSEGNVFCTELELLGLGKSDRHSAKCQRSNPSCPG
ncbi:hypothetical protein BS47DRAFT_1369623 [Hydnum rufescens UP504]|uniref:Uncharacterized protein n=1 Tax=Hydnum rufescens UP504 TaxID=1448309 RepID=A0A9P6DGC3_9AGAM|nr:hypothetical protein BS47DRAFT_1369623 [Hydnum rufescens UP504]